VDISLASVCLSGIIWRNYRQGEVCVHDLNVSLEVVTGPKKSICHLWNVFCDGLGVGMAEVWVLGLLAGLTGLDIYFPFIFGKQNF
jgi:hypothetical protein